MVRVVVVLVMEYLVAHLLQLGLEMFLLVGKTD
jgi:hypothetical protein